LPDKYRYVRRESRDSVYRRDHGRCRYCGAVATELDHVDPSISDEEADYANSPANLVLACSACNKMKGRARIILTGAQLREYADTLDPGALFFIPLPISKRFFFGETWATLMDIIRDMRKKAHGGK